MLDVGHSGKAAPRPEDSLVGLKSNLPDPAGYFLGENFDSLVLPGSKGEYYAFPPAKEHVLRPRPEFQLRTEGFSPLSSFATGGLAEVWTGGCYPFDEQDLSRFPFGYKELGPYYGEVARRVGVSGVRDDLAAVFPVHDDLQEPLELDRHSDVLLSSYMQRRDRMNGRFGCLMGRARSAVLSRPLDGRKACDYSGRCLWGCPSGAFYTPSLTLAECRKFPNFQYCSGMYVNHFELDGNGRVRSVNAVSGAREHDIEAGSVVLAAGTLCSARIFLESMFREHGKAPELHGVMDNRQVLMPFVNLRMVGRQWNPASYQYHQLAMAVKVAETGQTIHGLITTLKTALIHPLVQTLPFDLGTSASAFRHLHGALGMVNINFPDYRRSQNYIALETSSRPHRLIVHYEPDATEPERLRKTIAKFRKILLELRCFSPTGTIHVRPMGASVHYAGTLPMSETAGPLTCSPDGASNDVGGLYFADGSTFPDLPAKNLTFTLMANAARMADRLGN
jgi:choline dehydrogenase-like flavoprotein